MRSTFSFGLIALGTLLLPSCASLKTSQRADLGPAEARFPAAAAAQRIPATAPTPSCALSLSGFLDTAKNLLSKDAGVEEELRAFDDFWKIKEPFVVSNTAGSKSILTYSTDSELGDADVLRLLAKYPELLQQLSEVLQPVPIATLLVDLRLSEKQFQTFALRKSVSKTEKFYKPSDLNPEYFAFMFAKQKPSLPFATPVDGTPPQLEPLLQKYLDLVELALEKQQPKFHAHFDPLGPIEVSHKTFESAPLDFASTMRAHHKLFKFPMSHIHLGVESTQVSGSQAKAIGRALEVQIIFDLIAQDAHPKTSLPLSWGSTLGESNRGLVFVKPEAFTTAAGHAHDIELRQYNNLPHGLRLLSFASLMSKNPEKIIVFEEHMQRGTSLDQSWGAAAGALKYVAKMIEHNSQDPTLTKLVGELMRLSEIAQGSSNIAPETREEIHRLIVDNNLVEKLRLNLFLKQ